MIGLVSPGKQVPSDFYCIVQYVAEHVSEEISLEDLANAAGVSRFTLCRKFERRFGISAMRWLWNVRVYLARAALEGRLGGRITDVAVLCGFNSVAHFSRMFKSKFNNTPTEILQAAADTQSFFSNGFDYAGFQSEVEKIALLCLHGEETSSASH